jgi:hypothetical protein
MGPIGDRRGFARKLAAELIQRADMLMYDAKGRKSEHVHCTAVAVANGHLADLAIPADDDESTSGDVAAMR